jgi:hypothetical protein
MRSIFRNVTTIILVFIVVATCGAAFAEPPMGPVTVTASNPGDQFNPAVAADQEHDQWLVVWEQEVSGVLQIVGRMVNRDGYPTTNSFFITDAALDQTDPDVVYDPGHDRYLVVWTNQFSATDSDITGRFIPWNGLDPAQLAFGIEAPTTLQFAPALEYAPFPVDEYFVVWADIVNFDPATIRAKRLYPDSGSQVGPSFEVVGDATYQRRNPAVAWNADAGRYLVAYERFEGTAQEDVYAAGVSYNGTVFSPDLGIAGYSPEENQIDVAACDGSWMVVWKNGQDPTGAIFVRPVAGDLSLGSSTDVSVNPNPHWPAVACNPHGGGFFMVWDLVYTDQNFGIRGAFLAADGALRDRFIVMKQTVGETRSFTRPVVSVGDYQSRAFVVWETDRDDLVHHDLAGRWVEMVLFADGFETGDTWRWSLTVP